MFSSTKPRPRPEPGEVVYSRSTAVRAERYENESIREYTEVAIQRAFKEKTGLTHQWDRWMHYPETEHTDEATGRTHTLPETWVYVCEAVGPEELVH